MQFQLGGGHFVYQSGWNFEPTPSHPAGFLASTLGSRIEIHGHFERDQRVLQVN